MLNLEDVTKRFGAVTAISQLTIEVKTGEIFVLLGPTGAGKTTTLRVVAGLEKPDEGRIILDGKDVTRLSPAYRNVAMIFEAHNLYPIYNVYDNIAFPLRSDLFRMPEAEIRAKITKVASDLHIEHLLNRQITTLSGGEIQRAAIARTLIRTPRIYLMDEPLSNLDLKLREELRVEFRELHKRYGATMFYVTHDFVSAVSIADRIGILSQGILHQVGSYSELHSDPQTTVVAELMESPPMNFLPCAVENGSLVVNREAGIVFPLTERQQADIQKQATDGLILLGVWPEDIQLGLGESAGGFQGKIIGREFQGADTLINVSVGKINVKTLAEPGFKGRFGELCTFSFPKEKAYLFDQTSGKRVYGDWGSLG